MRLFLIEFVNGKILSEFKEDNIDIKDVMKEVLSSKFYKTVDRNGSDIYYQTSNILHFSEQIDYQKSHDKYLARIDKKNKAINNFIEEYNKLSKFKKILYNIRCLCYIKLTEDELRNGLKGLNSDYINKLASKIKGVK